MQPPPEPRLEALATLWRQFAEYEYATYSPVYARIGHAVAADRDLLGLVLEAPPEAHLPNVLMSAVHYLVLGAGPAEGDGALGRLAALYGRAAERPDDADRTPEGDRAPEGEDPASLFRAVCLGHRDRLSALLATRRIQTNEVGRSAVLALGLAAAARRVGGPLTLLDAGASAGLNLLYDHYRLDYGPAGALGPPASPVRVECAVRTPGPALPRAMPRVEARLGLDRSPVDLSDPDDARWLLACVWPDTGRLGRAAAAIDLARRAPVEIVRGDLVDDLAGALERLGRAASAAGTRAAVPVVLTSWSCSYLPPEGRDRFTEVLASEGRSRPVAWLCMDAPGVAPLFPVPAHHPEGDTGSSLLGLAVFDRGGPQAETLAWVHPHGAWIDWCGPSGP